MVALVLGSWASARAQTEITLDTPFPAKGAIGKIVPGFEAKTGYTVKVHVGTGLGTKQDAAHGEAYDVFLILPPFNEALASGNLIKSTGTVVSSFVLALTVKKGTPLPDISTTESVRKALLSAHSIVTADANADSVGLAAEATLRKLGIFEQVRSKIKYARNGNSISRSVIAGEGEIGLGPYVSDLRSTPPSPDLVVVGGLPRGASPPTDIYAFVATRAQNVAAAKALVKYLKAPEAEQIYKENGILPH